MKTAIITDSNSGITRELGEQWGVRIVPMPIIIENETYYEGVDLFPEEFFRMLREGKSVSTSQPAPEDILRLWEEALSSGYDEVVYIPMTSGLSSSCQTALILAADFGGRVQVADNHQISVPLKNAVRDALALAEAGLSAQEIKARLEAVGMDSLIYIGVDTLEYLRRGGRITPAVAAMGTVLGIKPLLAIRGERLDTFAKVRGTKHCKALLIESMQKSVESCRKQGIPIRIDAAGSFDRREEEAEWRELAAGAFPGEAIHYDPLSLSISSHTGPGAFAMGLSRRIA